VPTEPVRLRWRGAEALDDETRARLIGPGAPFELVEEDVLGATLTVFARRPRNLREVLDTAAEKFADRTWLVAGETELTYPEVRQAVAATAKWLADEYDIAKGDRVAIVAANSIEYAVTAWATLTLGAILVSLNGWWTGVELDHGIALSEPKLLVGDERRLERVTGEARASVPDTLLLEELVAAARAAAPDDLDLPTDEIDEDDPAIILFTSGTTGRSKGALLSHRNVINFGQVVMLAGAIGAALAPPPPADAPPPSQPASIVGGPFFHISGLVALCITGPVIGSKLVFNPPGRWDETEFLRLTEQHRISAWSGVPTQYWRILGHPDLERFDVSSVRSAGGGGAVFQPELIRLMKEKFPHIAFGTGYGMSETTGLGTTLGGQMQIDHADSVGVAQVGVEVEVRDLDGVTVPEGEVGEIYLRTASTFIGYWNNPEATTAAFAEDRWYRTGDFGRISDGKLFLESRMRDLILRGGENIYPIEIENRLIEHPDIDDAAVIGVDHPTLGQEVKAFVVVRPGAELSTQQVQEFAAEGLARFKVPAYVELRPTLPYTETGKLLKHQLEKEDREARAAAPSN
jgi:acyl-CoA synthetase (AMP-forming)/AMP-acid ligase II